MIPRNPYLNPREGIILLFATSSTSFSPLPTQEFIFAWHNLWKTNTGLQHWDAWSYDWTMADMILLAPSNLLLQQPSEIKIFSNHSSVFIITLGLPKEKGDLYHMEVNWRPFEHFSDQEYIVCFSPILYINSRFWASLNPKEVTTNSLGREFFHIHSLWKCSGLTGACVFVLELGFCKAWRARFSYRTCRYHSKLMNLDEFRWGLAWVCGTVFTWPCWMSGISLQSD